MPSQSSLCRIDIANTKANNFTASIKEFNAIQDVPKVSMPAEVISKVATAIGYTNILVELVPEKATKPLMGNSASDILMTGSFYLHNHVRPIVEQSGWK